jgi:glutaredoxin
MSNRTQKPFKITLYHAKWCDHCVKFQPIWNKMKENKDACEIIDFVDHEELSFKNLKDKDLSVEGRNVQNIGYPTIKININKNREYMFNGNRTINEIYNSIIKTVNEINGVDVSASISESENQIDIMMSSSPAILESKKDKKRRYDKWNP